MFFSQRKYWDSVAPKKEFTTDFQKELLEQFAARNAAILDVGCGYGRTMGQLRDAGFTNLHGVDYASRMIERGKALYPELDFRTAEGTKIPFPDASMDAVLLLAVLTCVADSTEQEAILSEIYRVLRPHGILYVNDFLINDDERNLERYALAAEKYAGRFPYGTFELPEGALLRHHAPEHLRDLLSRFFPLRSERVTFQTMNGHTSHGLVFLGRKPQMD